MSNAPGYACLFRAAGADPAALVALAADFSPRYERLAHPTGDLVVIDISGLERMFSGERLRPCPQEAKSQKLEGRSQGRSVLDTRDVGAFHAIGWALAREATARGLRVNVAIAGMWTAAVVLAQAHPGLTVIEPGGEAAALAPLPVGVLATTPELEAVAPVFRAWGVRTLGELAALPRADLVSRFGRRSAAWQAMARGDDVRPLVPMLAEERFESSVELEWPIEELEPLSFVLTRLLEPLATRLERRDRAAVVLHLQLGLVSLGPDSDERVSRRLQLPSPMRDVRTLRTLLLLDLESHPPGAPIDRVTLVIDPSPGRILQHTLFARAHPTPEQLSTLLARLGALMGQDRIGSPEPVDSYRPGDFDMRAFGGERGAGRSGGSGREDSVTRPSLVQSLRRCRQPIPARVMVEHDRPVRVSTDRRGFCGGAVRVASGPWRVSGNWWAPAAMPQEVKRQKVEGRSYGCSVLDTREGHGPSVSGAGVGPRADEESGAPPPVNNADRHSSFDRDEWDVALSDGARYRIFCDRGRGAWFIDAVID